MTGPPASFLAREAHLVALGRALAGLTLDELAQPARRSAAFAAAGVAPDLGDEQEAMRRRCLWWTLIAPLQPRERAA